MFILLYHTLHYCVYFFSIAPNLKKLKRVYQKVDNDFNEFEKDMLNQSAKEIYDKAYKISYISELYEFLRGVYHFTAEEVKIILAFKGNILEQIYEEWIYGDYSIREEFDYVIDSALCGLQKVVKLCA